MEGREGRPLNRPEAQQSLEMVGLSLSPLPGSSPLGMLKSNYFLTCFPSNASKVLSPSHTHLPCNAFLTFCSGASVSRLHSLSLQDSTRMRAQFRL